MRALLIDSDELMAQNIRRTLRRAEICLDTAEDYQEGMDLLRLYDFDIVLAGTSDTEVIRRLRKGHARAPILALTLPTAERKVEALHAGADDSLAKPFHPDELVGRIHALVRRYRGYAESEIHIGAVTLDLSSKTVESNGRKIRLTDMEYQIFELLLLRPGVAVPRETFISHLYGDGDGPESRTIEHFICKLRKKLADATGGDSFVHTIRNQGYLLRHDRAA